MVRKPKPNYGKNEDVADHERVTTEYGDSQFMVYGDTEIEILANSGDSFIIDEIWKKHEYEDCTYDKDDVWLDLGAHVGSFAIWASPKVKQIFSFEPDPRQLFYFKRNAERNGIRNVVLNEGAVTWDDRETAVLYVKDKGHRAENTLFPVRGRKEVHVDCWNINQLIEELHPNKIKMDIEGPEVEVTEAITDKNWDSIEEIVMEFHFRQHKDWPHFTKYNRILDVLKKHFGYLEYAENPKKSWFGLIYARKEQ